MKTSVGVIFGFFLLLSVPCCLPEAKVPVEHDIEITHVWLGGVKQVPTYYCHTHEDSRCEGIILIMTEFSCFQNGNNLDLCVQ
jgi:hypothetical protein